MVSGQVTLITGASHGLGKALARAFARYCCPLVLCARESEPLELLRGELSAQGAQVVARPVDVSDGAQVSALVHEGLQAFGRIDVLINNAAIGSPYGLLEKIEATEWDRVMAVNVRGPLLLAQAVVPSMRSQRFGRIINITSNMGVLGSSNYGAYSVSKAALNAQTRCLAAELGGTGILVNGLDPGAFQSRMNPSSRLPADTPVADALYLASLGPDGPTGRFFRGCLDLGW